MADLVGQILDSTYRVDKLLGQGGMGAVYKGMDIALNREVAIKVMHPHIAQQPGFRDRFLQEARAIANLEHPGIVQVYSFSRNPDLLYIAMAFVPGQNLRDWLHLLNQKGLMVSLPESLALVETVAEALAYAHRRGVYHRDIKPGNIILRPLDSEERIDAGLSFQPVVTDFGLAKLSEGGVHSVTGMSMGTPAYMAPEQCEGLAVDGRADIYALGIVLYEMITGEVPFSVRTLTEAIRAHTQQPPPPPRSVVPDLPSQVEEIVLTALAKAPADRYASAAELARALRVARQALPKPEEPTLAADQTAGRVSLMTMLAEA
jgi:serine/threonine protein kinase